jgi:[ribosomal protein S5]-alanine N-acetyltransferase
LEKEDIKKQLLPSKSNVTVEGRHVILKPITPDEVNEEYLSWLNNPEINKYLEIRFKKQEFKDIIEYINGLRGREGCELLAIFTKKNLKHIGTIGIVEFDLRNGTILYGVMIGNLKAQAMGLGGEAIGLMLEYLFKDRRVRKVWGGAIADHDRAWKTSESLGLKREGVLRQHRILDEDRFSDEYIYSIFREEWEESKKKFRNLFDDIKIKR